MRVVEGRVFYRGELQDLCVGIEDGKIAALRKTLRGDEGHSDFGNRLILPGGIDIHVHFRDPGMTEKEDFASGTRSAAIGGVTTVFDMPNTIPPATTATALREKLSAVKGRAHVDFGLYAGVAAAPGRLLTSLRKEPLASGLKVYTAESTGGLAPKWAQVPAILEGLAETDLPVLVHAEDPSLFGLPGKDLRGHDLARPVTAEASAVDVVASSNGGAHITHVTAIEGLEAVRRFHLACDVTPHHLLFDTDSGAGARLKVNPPLRAPRHRARLWEAFVAGEIPIVASDHAPHLPEEKERFDEAASGTPGVATTYPVLLRLVKSGELPLSRLVDAFCTRPAAMFGLNKGQIEIGRDADLAVFDPGQVTKITAKRTGYKCGWTAFEGLEAVFPEAVFVRGATVVRGDDVDEENAGQPVAQTP